MMENIHEIRTPEGIVFTQTLAGPLLRFTAWLIDSLLIIAAIMMTSYAVSALRLLFPDLGGAVMYLVSFALIIGYRISLEWWMKGQTVGKRVCRLRVVDAEGLRLRFSQVVIRNLLRAVDVLPGAYLLGGLCCWFSPRAQRLGDLAANTLVVLVPRSAQPDLGQLLAGKYNSLRAHPHLAARLRQRVSPAEADLALQALLRREQFEPLARVQLFDEMSRHFLEKVEFPPEAVADLAPEQHVRNVVDIVYRPRGETPG